VQRVGLKRSISARMLALVQFTAIVGLVCPSSGAAARIRRLASSTALALAAMLVVFHVALFCTHLSQGRLLEPAVALRWVFGLMLLGALWALRRGGVPLLWGRRALVVWVLVAVLHAGAAVPTASDSLSPSPGDALTLVVLPPAAGLIFAAAMLLLVALARSWRLPVPLPRPVRPARAARLRSAFTSPRLAPRAPPVSVTC
jgi:hypothetical protein